MPLYLVIGVLKSIIQVLAAPLVTGVLTHLFVDFKPASGVVFLFQVTEMLEHIVTLQILAVVDHFGPLDGAIALVLLRGGVAYFSVKIGRRGMVLWANVIIDWKENRPRLFQRELRDIVVQVLLTILVTSDKVRRLELFLVALLINILTRLKI